MISLAGVNGVNVMQGYKIKICERIQNKDLNNRMKKERFDKKEKSLNISTLFAGPRDEY